MGRVTDGERREVARMLREKSRNYARKFSSSHTSTNAYHEVREVLYGTDGAPKSLCEFFDRLADLIDPDCEEGRYSVARTARPVDREALLALADDVAYSAAMATAVDASKSAKLLAELLLDIARRIREALGVSDD